MQLKIVPFENKELYIFYMAPFWCFTTPENICYENCNAMGIFDVHVICILQGRVVTSPAVTDKTLPSRRHVPPYITNTI